MEGQLASVNEVSAMQSSRVYILVHIYGSPQAVTMLYDCGSDICCIKTSVLQKFPKEAVTRVSKVLRARAATGSKLDIEGVYNVSVEILGRKLTQEFASVRNLYTDALIGLDLIKTQGLSYSVHSGPYWEATPREGRLTKRTYLQPQSKTVARIRLEGPLSSKLQVVQIQVGEQVSIARDEYLVEADDDQSAVVVLTNAGSRPVELPRGLVVASVEAADPECLAKWDAKSPMAVARTSPDTAPVGSPPPKPILSAQRRKKILDMAKIAEMDGNLKAKYQNLLLRHHSALSTTEFEIGLCRRGQHSIPFENEHASSYQKQFPLAQVHEQEINRQLDQWLKLGIVRSCESEHNSPLFIVKKKTAEGQPQKFRVVQDLRGINAATTASNLRLPEIGEALDIIGQTNPRVFSSIDLRSGYWGVEITPRDQAKTAFTVPNRGQYCFRRGSMGLRSMPMTFMRIMQRMFCDLIAAKKVIVYIDDILLFSSNHSDHLRLLAECLKRLESIDLRVNMDKSCFGQKELCYLGFQINEHGYRPDPANTKDILKSPVPQTLKAVRGWIGKCQFYRNHFKDFTMVVKPLTSLTSGKEWSGGQLPQNAIEAFEKIKRVLTTRPVLNYAKSNLRYHLFVDGSIGQVGGQDGGLGAVLVQYENDDETKPPRVIGYASRGLLAHEKNYSSFLIESAAAVFGIEAYSKYLTGRHFILWSDHKPLLKSGSANHARSHARFKELLSNFDFTIRHRSGKTMPADVLSRYTCNRVSCQEVDVVQLAEFGGLLGQGSLQSRQVQFSRDQEEDPLCVALSDFVKSKTLRDGPYRALVKRFGPSCIVQENLLKIELKRNGIERLVLVLPARHHAAVLAEAHGSLLGGHAGEFKTVERILSSYWFPGVHNDVSEFIKECPVCLRNKKFEGKNTPLEPLPASTVMNERVHMDLYGPLQTESGKKFVLVIIDAFTKFAIFHPIDSKEPIRVADVLFKQWICVFGKPASIVCDRGKEFCCALMKRLAERLQIDLRFVSTQHPQANGQVEMVNKKIKKYLMATCSDRPTDWEVFLPACQLSWNSSVNKATKNSPFSLLFGLDARTPLSDLNFESRPYYSDEYQDQLWERLQVARKVAIDNNVQYRTQYKNTYDKSVKESEWKPGMLVWLHSPELLKINQKIRTAFAGPFVILSLISRHNVLIQHLKSHKTKMVNVNRLRVYNLENRLTPGMPRSGPAD